MSDTSSFSKHRKGALSLIWLAGALTAVSQSSYAQQAESQPPASLFGEKTDVAVGMGMVVAPRFMGSNQTRALLVPTVSISRGIFFADSTRGIGAEYLSDSGFYISSALSYDPGRMQRNSSWRAGSKHLQGMGDVTGTTTADIQLSQSITSWLAIDGEAEFRTAGYKRGDRYRLGLESTVLSTGKDTVTLGLNAHIGDHRYNNTYFGVSEQQEQDSHFSRFDAKSGVYAYSATVDWQHSFTPHWTLLMGMNLMAFSDRAHHSPLLESNTSAAGFAMLDYTF